MARPSRPWTPFEDAQLAALWGATWSLATIAAFLRRSRSATRRRAVELRLDGPERYSLREACAAIGISRREALSLARQAGVRLRRAPVRAVAAGAARHRPYALTLGQVQRLAAAAAPAIDRHRVGELVDGRLRGLRAHNSDRGLGGNERDRRAA